MSIILGSSGSYLILESYNFYFVSFRRFWKYHSDPTLPSPSPALQLLRAGLCYFLHCPSRMLTSKQIHLVKKRPQEKISRSLVMKLKKWDALYFWVLPGVLHTVYHESSALLKKCTWYFFQHGTSSESNCNRSFQGQPAGWNRLIIVMCTSTRVLP